MKEKDMREFVKKVRESDPPTTFRYGAIFPKTKKVVFPAGVEVELEDHTHEIVELVELAEKQEKKVKRGAK